MKKTVALILCVGTTAYAGYGGMGGPAEGGDSGGELSLVSFLLVIGYFGGIYWFLTRFKNEQDGFFWLFGSVLVFMVVGGISQCSG